MEADFSGWATKAGTLCSDGRTIMPDAFKHQDQVKVPLVWQHGHNDPENVLGHVLLTNKPEGVWCDAFFNKTAKAIHAREMVIHRDINSLSIWANELREQARRVIHGMIREVSLVLAGANPGARIENINLRHSDGELEPLDDEYVIYGGIIEHAEGDDDGDGETVQDVYDSMNEKQKQVVNYMIGEAIAAASDGELEQSALDLDDQNSIQATYDSMSESQVELLHHMIGAAITDAEEKAKTTTTQQEGTEIMHNVFEGDDKTKTPESGVLSHDAIKGIVEHAEEMGSLKKAVEAYAKEHLAHGIQDIDTLFPEAKNITTAPELFGRRMEWVNKLLTDVRKSPFARIKTLSADLTVQEARAKGYITGEIKKEEFFRVKGRITTPQTIYKKQKLDRDDMIDITDFDVVVWLKGEMRIMLDEELARAILVGDGRAVDDEDKIKDPANGQDGPGIRSIANDHELYTSVVNVNINDASSSMLEVSDAIVMNRSKLRGSGTPTMFTTEYFIARWMTLRDQVGRKLYKDLDELAKEFRVKEIVPVEVLEEYEDIVAIIVNPMDYVVGADKGGAVSMFDDFDIDYNQYKYLIETRASGALVKLKAAMVVKKTAGANVLVVPAAPAFDGQEITITNQTGVIYRNADTDAVMNAAGSPYAVAEGVTVNVVATPDTGYYFSDSDVDDWSFTGEEA